MSDKTKIPKRVEVGQLFKVHTSFYANHNSMRKRGVKTEMIPGDILEIRYPFAWHFRMSEGYFQIDEETLLANSNFYGVINGDVQFKNKASLEEILENKYYQSLNDLIFGGRNEQS